ncbi:complement inhibitor SCIN family protein [Lentilactobacillus sp. SPB1-3]|uniref:Complement inhibitor SCIN family protein n=1 Tax=Lentilactobacillus terminaliae TaxID=3003483 RepID=A0ACD5DD06_9LACO
MKISKYVLTGVAAMLLGITAIANTPTNTQASSAVPARMQHRWKANKWGINYHLNCYKYHANFYDGRWHKLYYTRINTNTFTANPKGNAYNGITIKYKGHHNMTVLYDVAHLHFYR